MMAQPHTNVTQSRSSGLCVVVLALRAALGLLLALVLHPRLCLGIANHKCFTSS
jgi:hypothetical protein